MEWRAHRLWIILLALAIIIALGNKPILGIAQQKELQKWDTLRADEAAAKNALRQLQDDIAATEKLKNQIDAKEVEKSLAPVNRLRAAQILEHRAAEQHLTHFTYTLSPEQKTLVETVGAGAQELTTSQLTLTADLPTDADAYAFFDALRRTLPGRFSLRQFSIQRSGADDRPIAAENLRLTASGEWLSNGAGQNMAEEK